MMKALIAVLVLAALAQMAQAQTTTPRASTAAVTATAAASAATTAPAGQNGTACTALTDGCRSQANAILANITSLLPNILKGGIKEQIRQKCNQLTGLASCYENAAKADVCKGIPDVVKRFKNSVSIPRTCGGACHLPNVALALAAVLTAMLVGKLEAL